MIKSSTLTKLNNYEILSEIQTKEGPLVVIKKQYLNELLGAVQAIVRGEDALASGKTKSFKSFLRGRS